MLIVTEDQSAFHLSTDGLPPGERLPAYCDLFGSMLAGFDTKALDGELRCEARWRSFAELKVLRVASTPVHVTWSRARRGYDDDRLILAMFWGGNGAVSQRGREAEVARGGAIVLSGTEPVAMARTHYTYFSLPRAALAPMVGDADAALMSLIPAGSETLRLLSGYADLVTGNVETMRPEVSRLAETHVRDILALVIGATRDAAEVAKGRGLRAARLRAIEADIERNLASGNVRPAVLAARHGVTPRYLHKLFEAEGTTLSHYVLNKRLARVHSSLTDPRLAARAIGSIAYDAGFADLSTFNREFRRRYGATPSDVRAATRGRNGSA
jgi:AraC-like DNA-binding protein